MSDAGEIIGRLKLDASDWMSKIEEAKGEAESLKAVDPKIQVTADTAGAIAGLTAVAASADKVAVAEERLRVATQASDRATAQALIAQMRLDDVQNKRGRTALQVASAEEALRYATEKSDNAARKAVAAEEALAAARKAAAASAVEEGAAADVAGEKTTNAAKGPIPWMGILIGSIAAVSPGIVAVGAAAIGLTGSLAGMGVAGVLAFKGIEAEMASGSALGNQYSAMFDGLTSDLQLLEHTAAVGIFAGLSSGIRTLESDIGPLNQDVDLLSRQLGGLLAEGATVAVHAFNGFGPVLVAAGGALQGFLHGIDSFTTSNGFTDFIQYTVARLPDVMHLIDSTLGALGGIFTGLAPAGQATLFMLSGLMDLVRALSPTIAALMPTVIGVSDAIGGIAIVVGHVLSALGPLGPAIVLTGAAVIGLSYASKALAPALASAATESGVAAVAVRGLGAAVDFASGPIGIAVLALGFLASALITGGDGATSMAASLTDLNSALDQDSGVVGSNTRTLVANTLAQNGAIDAAARMHIGAKLLTDAATGNAAALKQVTGEVNKQQAALDGLQTRGLRPARVAFQQQQEAIDKTRAAVTQGNAALKSATDQYNKVAVATGQAKVSQEQMAAAAAKLHMPVAQFAAAAAASQKAADQADQLRAKYILAGDAANLLKLDMDKLNGATISNAEAQAAWASGLDSLKSSFNANSKAITGNSNAAIENRGAVASLAATGATAVQSLAGLHLSASQTTAAYQSMRGQLIQSVVDMGNSRKAATALVDQYFKIPKNIKTDFVGNDADAKAKAAAAKAAALDFAKGDYKAALKADPSQANSAKADAMSKAEAFAKAQYEAKYTANPSNANAAAMAAAAKAHWFGNGYYNAYLRAHSNAASVAAAARAELASVHSREVYLTVYASLQGSSNAAQIAMNASRYGATGGTATANGMKAPGMAGGGSPGFYGSVSGPGNASNDMAGLFHLANGEFVTSNMRGQADAFRGVLEAINSQKVKTPAQLGQMLGGQQGPTTVITRNIEPHVTFVNPVMQDLDTQAQETAQFIQAYSGI